MHSFALIHALFWACICRFAVSVTVGQKVALRRRQFFVVHHFLNQRAERRSWKDRWEGRLDWDAHVRTFTEDEFRLNYRVSFGLFNKLIREIGPRLRTANITKVLSIFTRSQETKSSNSRTPRPAVRSPPRYASPWRLDSLLGAPTKTSTDCIESARRQCTPRVFGPSSRPQTPKTSGIAWLKG